MTSTISVSRLKLFAKIGSTKEERAYPQRLEVDLEIGFTLTEGARAGMLDETICWDSLTRECRAHLQGREWILAEEAAASLGSFLLEHFPRIEQLRVRLRKYPFSDVESVGIELGLAR